jgi:hypothetical protein
MINIDMNNYLDIIWDLSLKNESAIDYIELCNMAISREFIDDYIERHHMLPKCVCQFDEQKKDKQNLVIFTYKEHFTAHRLLSEMFDGKIKRQMQKALSMMLANSSGERIFTPEEYEIAKKASSDGRKGIALSEEHKQKIRDTFAKSNPNKGRTVSDETKIRLSDVKKGKTRSNDVKLKISNTLKGIKKAPRTAEHTANFIKARTGIPSKLKGTKQSIISCPHCDKAGGPGAMKLHHFDKCKLRIDK